MPWEVVLPAANKWSGPLDFTLAGEAGATAGAGPRRSSKKPSKQKPPSGASGADAALVAALKAWRLAEARRAGVPAFRVLHDRTLLAIAAARPQHEPALLAVPGFGPALLKRYGKPLLALCHGTAGRGTPRP